MKFFKRYTCDRCGAKFQQQEELMNHLQLIHEDGHRYDCKRCDMDFASMEEMRTHLQRKHSYKDNR